MELNEIISELEHVRRGDLPRAALEQAVAQPELVTLWLLDNLSPASAQRFIDERTYMAPFHAMFLLAQFREQRAYPLIVEFVSDPEVGEILGDFATDDLRRVLASVCGDDSGPIRALAENPNADEFVRAAAAESLVDLVALGRVSREEVVEYFRELFKTGQPREESYFWSGLVDCATDLYPEELYPEIKQAFADELVDEMFHSLETVDDAIKSGKDAALEKLAKRKDSALIEDTVAEFEEWACFQPESDWDEESDWEEDWEPRTRLEPGWLQPPVPIKPVVKPPKVGRNEPCPCGSGKKYKKCCGA